MLMNIPILVIYFSNHDFDVLLPGFPILRNVPIGMLICLTVMIGIRIIRIRISVLKYTYVNYILCHHDRKKTHCRSINSKKCKTLDMPHGNDWNQDN